VTSDMSEVQIRGVVCCVNMTVIDVLNVTISLAQKQIHQNE